MSILAGNKTIISAVLIALIGIIPNLWMYLSSIDETSSKSQTDNLEIAFKRISILEQQVAVITKEKNDLYRNLAKLEFENLKLRAEAEYENEQRQTIESVLMWMPHPAWIKMVSTEETTSGVGNPVIRMIFINRAYENEYGVSAGRYKNKTDFDIWKPLEVAEMFYRQDLEVLKTQSSNCEEQTYSQDINSPNKLITRMVCKWYVELENGREGIAGVSLPIK